MPQSNYRLEPQRAVLYTKAGAQSIAANSSTLILRSLMMARNVLRFRSPPCIGIVTRALCSNINRMAARLTPECKSQSLGDASEFLRLDPWQFGGHTGISIGLIRISSVGIGRPSSFRLST